MIEKDTIRLLRECDAGIKMGISSIDDVMDYVCAEMFRMCLKKCKSEHEKLQDRINTLLRQYEDEGKEPNPISKGMSWIKTNLSLAVDNSDQTVADLMTEGCNMGVKSLSKYLNQYRAASEEAKGLCCELISLEEKLAKDIRCYL